MRIMVKGGVWKNTEDEILKAAVMKYGKNQWARISSLLVRKSAKQCKARWYEWLDPSIKKTEWSREEEEKLLHLAKIMPNQWKTIAPIVGRTASQCLEHYEKLLDAAQNREEGYDPGDDPRRLRPGEIDPNPESKPARPDPVDMDEDEKEMLSEARARLANTKGKKAKRKAREKQLEEARRLASLQKKRELKAAGIELPRPATTGTGRKKVKPIDYNKEIPFQRKPPPGFYEVDWEAETPKPGFKKIALDSLDGKRRRDEEDEARKADSKKQKIKEKKNLPAAIMQINKLNDPETVTARTRLMLPAPQLDDSALEDMAKSNEEEAYAASEEGPSATKALLPSYAGTPTPARNLRTPLPARTPAREDIIQREAQNLIALSAQATPLLGGENPQLHDSDFSGVTPKPHDVRTPHALATPARKEFATPLRPARTPARDTMKINEPSTERLEAQDTSLRKKLSMLPAPQNDYQIVLPELPAEDRDEAQEAKEDDASEVLLRQQRLEEEGAARELRLRSQVLQRELPRPLQVGKGYSEFQSKNSNPALRQAEEMLRKEVVLLIGHEASKYPLRQSKIQPPPSYDQFDEGQLKLARSLVERELAEMRASGQAREFSREELEEAWKGCGEELIFVPSQKKYLRVGAASKKDQADAVAAEFEHAKTLMGREAARASKLEQKLNVYNGGYAGRATGLLNRLQDLQSQLYEGQTELECFLGLQELERRAIPTRIERLTSEVKEQEDREAGLQWKYQNLVTERDNLLSVH